jgi:NTE family protein
LNWTGKKVGLALGGGGVRALAHIGVLEVLKQEGIGVDLIAGTSGGALIGAAYAAGLTLKEISARVDAYLASPEFHASEIKSIGLSFSPEPKTFFQKVRIYARNPYYLARALTKPSILPTQEFQTLIHYLLPDIDIRETRIPFCAVCTDLITGRPVVLTEGPLRQAVLASSSVPGAVEPVRLGQWLLADGGVTSLVPVQAVRDAGADVVIAVVVERDLPSAAGIDTAKDVMYRAGEITANTLEEVQLKDADVVIRPALGEMHWSDFSRAKDLAATGREAALEALDDVVASLPLSRRLSRWARRRLTKPVSTPSSPR